MKWNNNTLQNALTAIFTGIEELLPNEGTTNTTLNITMDTSKESLQTELNTIFNNMNSDCSTAPCSYTEDTVTVVTETLEANWTTLTETKTDDAVTEVLRNAFANFGKLTLQFKVNPVIICTLAQSN